MNGKDEREVISPEGREWLNSGIETYSVEAKFNTEDNSVTLSGDDWRAMWRLVKTQRERATAAEAECERLKAAAAKLARLAHLGYGGPNLRAAIEEVKALTTPKG